MVVDWLTAAGLVSAIAAAVGIGIVARRGGETGDQTKPGQIDARRHSHAVSGSTHRVA